MSDTNGACFEPGAGTNSLLGLRIGGLFGILVCSSIGVAIPFVVNVEKRSSLFFLLRAFAGGVVLATGEPGGTRSYLLRLPERRFGSCALSG